jgi:hypothetical protein
MSVCPHGLLIKAVDFDGEEHDDVFAPFLAVENDAPWKKLRRILHHVIDFVAFWQWGKGCAERKRGGTGVFI